MKDGYQSSKGMLQIANIITIKLSLSTNVTIYKIFFSDIFNISFFPANFNSRKSEDDILEDINLYIHI